jgi:CspA family cold shock protein
MSDQVFRGKVVFFDPKKGFGFISKEDGSGDLFVHFSNIVMEGFKTLRENQLVEYKLGSNNKGPQCIDVKVVDEE